MKKVYLSGPIGDELTDSQEHLRERRREFEKYAAKIRKAGYDVINPFDISDTQFKVFADDGEKPTRQDLMRADILAMASSADEVWLMPGWEESRGCDGEVHAALAIGLPVFDMERRRMITLSKTGMQVLMRPLCGEIAADVKKMEMNDEFLDL